MATSDDLREVFTAGRPLIEQWLDIAEQIAGLRTLATAKGLDWSQVKALLKAQIQDERDDSGEGKRVARIVEKAEFASAYADMLGLAKMNEIYFSGDHDPETGEVIEHSSFPATSPVVTPSAGTGGDADRQTIPEPEAAVRTPAVPLRTEAAPREDAVSAASVPSKRQWTHADPAHPDCLNPSQCGGFSNFARCDACKAAANMQVA